MKHTLYWLVVLSLALAGVSACGGGGATEITVTTTDFHFTPEEWTVPAGKEITLTIINNGTTEHEWVIIKQGETVTQPFDDDDEDKVYWEMEAGQGLTVTEKFTAPTEPGEYTIVCGLPTHIEEGMQGLLIVK